MKLYKYRVKAVGFGFGLAKNALNFTVLSNYDIEKDREAVMRKIRNELAKTWQKGFEIKSVTKEEVNYIRQ